MAMTWEIQAISRVRKEQKEKGFHILLKYEVLKPFLGERSQFGCLLFVLLSAVSESPVSR